MSKFITEENAKFQLKNWENKIFPQAMIEDPLKSIHSSCSKTMLFSWRIQFSRKKTLKYLPYVELGASSFPTCGAHRKLQYCAALWGYTVKSACSHSQVAQRALPIQPYPATFKNERINIFPKPIGKLWPQYINYVEKTVQFTRKGGESGKKKKKKRTSVHILLPLGTHAFFFAHSSGSCFHPLPTAFSELTAQQFEVHFLKAKSC